MEEISIAWARVNGNYGSYERAADELVRHEVDEAVGHDVFLV